MRNRFFLFLIVPFLFLFASPAHAAVAYDNSIFINGSIGGQTTLSSSFTVGSASNRVLYAFLLSSNSGVSLNSVTYNGVAMTLLWNNQNVSYVYYLDNPASGSNTLTATFGGSVYDIQLGAMSYSGVEPGGGVGSSFISNSNHTATVGLVSSSTSDWNVVMAGTVGGNGVTNGSISNSTSRVVTGTTGSFTGTFGNGNDSNGTVSSGSNSYTYTSAGSGSETTFMYVADLAPYTSMGGGGGGGGGGWVQSTTTPALTTINMGVVLTWFFLIVCAMLIPSMILYAVVELFARLMLSPVARLFRNGRM